MSAEAGKGLDRAGAAALRLRPNAAGLLAALDRDGEETRIVGGAIRNALLGRPVREIDLATTALPAETSRRAAAAGFRTVPTGLRHGTVTVLVAGEPFEVTTLREDVETDGRHAVVRFGRDFARDAARRDFTVNALSLGRDGTVHDTTGGLADLAARRIRFIGAALGRIREDYLRVLRFFRFHAEYAEGPIDPAGLDGAIRGRDGLAILSKERVRAELLKLLAARRGAETLETLERAGLLGRLVPAAAELGRLTRVAAAEGDDPDAVRRLAAALVRVPADADRLRDALRLSNAEHARLAAYARALPSLLGRGLGTVADARRLVAIQGIEPVRDLMLATAGEVRSQPDAAGRVELDAMLSGARSPPRFPLAAADLMARGLRPGPELGHRLAAERELWLAAGCPDVWSITG